MSVSRPEDAARVEDGVAADLRPVAHQRAELAQPGIDPGPLDLYEDIAGREFHIRDFHARPEMRPMAQDRVAHIVEVGHLTPVEEEGVLDLAGVADDAIVPDQHMLADVGVVADFAVRPDDGRPLNDDTVLDHRVFANGNIFSPMRIRPAKRAFSVGRSVACSQPLSLARASQARLSEPSNRPLLPGSGRDQTGRLV